MRIPVIQRYFSEDIFAIIKPHFRFLVETVVRSGFEYDLQLRDNYFNLYCKGNSIGKISYLTTKQLYKIEINYKFISDKIIARFKPQKDKNDYLVFRLSRKQLHLLFSSANLLSMANRVKKVNYQEETAFEQILIDATILADQT